MTAVDRRPDTPETPAPRTPALSRRGHGVIVTVLNAKGGVGKTTATVYLAAALAQAGLSVEVWDADAQGSATEWLDDAAESLPEGTEPPFTHHPVNAATLRRRRPVAADVVLIDTPPLGAAIQEAAAARADLVIVPTHHSALDMARTWGTLEVLGKAVRAVVLLTMANPRTRTYTEALEALDAEQQMRFATPVPRREEYKRAVGTFPEIDQTWQAVAADLTTAIERLTHR
ncbi:ParA family protein [Micrococcus luteus]|nr:ParA family protein [Micrococcus luteus]